MSETPTEEKNAGTKWLTVTEFCKKYTVRKSTVQYAVKKKYLDASIRRELSGAILIQPETAIKEYEGFKHLEWRAKNMPYDEQAAELEQLKAEATKQAKTKHKKEEYQTELARLEVEEKEGKLVNIEQVRKAAFKIIRSAREQLLNVPDRLAAELAAEADEFKVHRKMTEEINKALEGLSSLEHLKG